MNGATQPYPIHAALEIEDAKNALRAAIRSNRQQRSPRLRQEAAESFADILASADELADVRCVAAYVARPHEPGTLPLIERLAERGVRILLPVLVLASSGAGRRTRGPTTSRSGRPAARRSLVPGRKARRRSRRPTS